MRCVPTNVYVCVRFSKGSRSSLESYAVLFLYLFLYQLFSIYFLKILLLFLLVHSKQFLFHFQSPFSQFLLRVTLGIWINSHSKLNSLLFLLNFFLLSSSILSFFSGLFVGLSQSCLHAFWTPTQNIDIARNIMLKAKHLRTELFSVIFEPLKSSH